MNRFVRWQQQLSYAFDRLLPDEFSVSGGGDFTRNVVPAYLADDLMIYDVGGGKNPVIGPELRNSHNLRIVGLDLDAAELAQAPAGCYDRTVHTDITRYRGQGDADVVVCRTVLEHVVDVHGAIGALASIMRPDGRILLFVPSRNALFARLNLLLPESVKRRILFSMFPEKQDLQGFRAHYHRCTPRDLRVIAAAHGLEVELLKLYYRSSYFSFFAPLYVVWRIYQVLFRLVAGEQAAETFAMVLRRAQVPRDGVKRVSTRAAGYGVTTGPEVGVKWNTKRGCRASHLRTLGCLWLP